MGEVEKLEKEIELLNNLHRLEEEKNVLLKQLSESLRIKRIWPEAFNGGMTCGMRSMRKLDIWRSGEKICLAWFERQDGEKYILTRKQLSELVDENAIHRDYEHDD